MTESGDATVESESESLPARELEEKLTFLERQVERLREELGEAFEAVAKLEKRILRVERTNALRQAEEAEDPEASS